jgi:hypothetical protein
MSERDELQAMLGEAERLLHELRALAEQFGALIEQLAGVDWNTLAQQGKLAGIPRFLLVRTITDARNVLTTGQQDLTAILAAAATPDDEFAERLRAMVRLYADTPVDIHNRCQKLLQWLTTIDAGLQQRGEVPLTARLSTPPT